MTTRWIPLLFALWPTGLVAYALYMQHVAFLDPCPLCILQRLAYLAAAIAMVPALIRPGSGLWTAVSAVGYGLAALVGAAIAAWHVRLQNLPADQVPDCGPGLEYMLETLPLRDVLSQIFQGSGECADVVWTFMGLSMPGWSLVMFVLMTVTVVFWWRSQAQAR